MSDSTPPLLAHTPRTLVWEGQTPGSPDQCRLYVYLRTDGTVDFDVDFKPPNGVWQTQDNRDPAYRYALTAYFKAWMGSLGLPWPVGAGGTT